MGEGVGGAWDRRPCRERLRGQVRRIFERNEITPSAAAEELEDLAGRVQSLATSIDNLIAAFEALGVGTENLDYGEFEVGVMIPREEVSNQLRSLADELKELDNILLPFQELGIGTGSRPDYEIRSISSSAFQIFLQSPGATAAAISVAVERLVALYKQLLEIRIAQEQLADAGVSDDRMGGIKEHADQHMEVGIGEIVDELMEQFGKSVEEGRANELRIELRVSLNRIANRIDHGYHVEVRAGLPPPDDEEDEGDDDGGDGPGDEVKRYFEAVSSRQEGLKYINLTGSPILSLPESSDQPDATKKKTPPTE